MVELVATNWPPKLVQLIWLISAVYCTWRTCPTATLQVKVSVVLVSVVGWKTGKGIPRRIALLSSSATYTFPRLSTATPLGALNRAALLMPSVKPRLAYPQRPPMVLTTQFVPERVIFRIALLSKSAI